MSLEKTASGPVLRCDACPETFAGIYDAGDWRALKTDARALGWRVHSKNGQWRDSCPACVSAFARENRRGGRLL